MAEKIKTKNEEKTKAAIYLRKAGEFHDVMLSAQATGKWNAAGLNAVHCVISAADAVLVLYAGLRSMSKDHGDVFRLLTLHIPKDRLEGVQRHLEAVIRKKNLIEYESRECAPDDARDMIKHAERFFKWAQQQVRQ